MVRIMSSVEVSVVSPVPEVRVRDVTPVAFPMAMVSAPVPPVPMLMVSAAVPVPKLMVLAKFEVKRFPVPPAPAGRSRVSISAPLVVVSKK